MYIKEIVGLFSSFKYVPSLDPWSIFLTSSHESSRMVGLGLTSTFCLPYSDHLFTHTRTIKRQYGCEEAGDKTL